MTQQHLCAVSCRSLDDRWDSSTAATSMSLSSGSADTSTSSAGASVAALAKEQTSKAVFGKSGKKICCSCPDTKRLR